MSIREEDRRRPARSMAPWELAMEDRKLRTRLGVSRQVYRGMVRRSRKASAAVRTPPFSGVFHHGDPVNPPHGNVRGLTITLSPILALMLNQALRSRNA